MKKQSKPKAEKPVGRIPAKPAAGLLDPNFQYRNAASTNVQETWKRFGWTPPSTVTA